MPSQQKQDDPEFRSDVKRTFQAFGSVMCVQENKMKGVYNIQVSGCHTWKLIVGLSHTLYDPFYIPIHPYMEVNDRTITYTV